MADKTRFTGNLVSGSNIIATTDTNNVGLGTTQPVSKLQVIGNAIISGVVTATTFVGNLTGTATNVIGGIGSLSQLQVSGISTFTSGPVLIGSATSTGTPSQTLQVTGGSYFSSNIGIGTTNPTRLLHLFGDGTSNQLNVGVSLNALNTTGFGAFYALNSSKITSGRDFRIISTGTSDTAGVGKLSIYDMASGIDRVVIDGSGNVGLGSTNPSARLTVVGNTVVSGIITANTYMGSGSQLYINSICM